MKKYLLKKYKNRVWQVAELLIYEGERLIKTISINRFYEVTDQWFYQYDEVGGSGYGYKKGDIIRRIFIGDAEFETIEINETALKGEFPQL